MVRENIRPETKILALRLAPVSPTPQPSPSLLNATTLRYPALTVGLLERMQPSTPVVICIDKPSSTYIAIKIPSTLNIKYATSNGYLVKIHRNNGCVVELITE